MTNVLIITSILLSVAALWAALVRARASVSEAGALRERLGRELSSLRERLESGRQRIERQEARLDALAAAQEEARREGETAVKERAAQSLDVNTAADSTPAEAGKCDESAAAETREEHSDVYALARAMEDFFNDTTHPRELLGHEGFRRGVELSSGAEATAYGLLARAAEGNALVACVSLEALARREGDDEAVAEGVLRDINAYYYWPRFFALRALAAHAGGRDLLAPLLARLNSTWREPMPLQALREFVAERVAAGDAVTPRDLADEADALGLGSEQWAEVCATLDAIAAQLPAGARAELSRWQGSRQTAEFVKSIGRVWEDEGDEVFVLDAVAAQVSELEAADQTRAAALCAPGRRVGRGEDGARARARLAAARGRLARLRGRARRGVGRAELHRPDRGARPGHRPTARGQARPLGHAELPRGAVGRAPPLQPDGRARPAAAAHRERRRPPRRRGARARLRTARAPAPAAAHRDADVPRRAAPRRRDAGTRAPLGRARGDG